MVPVVANAQVFEGQASFYNDKLHGNETASGEKYDKFALTAAHLTLPFGTLVKVTNLWNGKSVEVKINDRGPFGKERRIIDVSKQAALELDMVTAGIVDVKVEVLADKPARPLVLEQTKKEEAETNNVRGDGTYKVNVSSINTLSGYGVQIGSYSDFLAVLKKLEELEQSGFPDLYINTAMVTGKRYYRIVVGNFEKKAEAELYLMSIKSENFDGYVIRHQE